MRTKPHGQTLVLFALTMLLMTLLVLMTLSFGSKVKSRMEVQTVADATAYSNAVATARSMNAIAVMNRVNVAQVVSTTGTLSLISWVTLYYKHAANVRDLWLLELAIFAVGTAFWCTLYCGFSLCNPAACAGCKIGILQTGVAAALTWFHASQIKKKLNNDIVLFNNETRPRWFASQQIFAQQGLMYTNLLDKMNNPASTFAKGYSSSGNMPGVTPNAAPAAINASELKTAMQQGSVADPYHASMIVNASRGHKFIPWRKGVAGGFFGAWAVKLSVPWSLPAGWAFTDGNDEGRGYVNSGFFNWPAGEPYGHVGGSWGQDLNDHTRVLLVKPFGAMCTIFGAIALVVGLMGKGTGGGPTVGPFVHPMVHNGVQHSYPQTFPPFYDYNPTNPNGIFDTDDIYSAPKNMSMVSADPMARNDPWESRGTGSGKAVNMKFTPGATGFDMTNEPATHTGGMQNAIGSGVTYYSRPDHFEEPPNLFAPYWRSGLTRMTVDRPSAGSGGRAAYDANLQGMFGGSGQGEAGVAFQELVNSGYKGFE